MRRKFFPRNYTYCVVDFKCEADTLEKKKKEKAFLSSSLMLKS